MLTYHAVKVAEWVKGLKRGRRTQMFTQVQPILFQIKDKHWAGVQYKERTPEKEPEIYLLGEMPRTNYIQVKNQTWIISGFNQSIKPEHAEYMPFGIYFMLRTCKDEGKRKVEGTIKKVPTPEQILNECEKANPGMGIECVRHILFYFNKGEYQSAFNICLGENDKIRQYPKVRKLLWALIPEYFEDLDRTRQTFGWKKIP